MDVLREITKDKAFYEISGGGATFSGGECMLQIDFLEDILRLCKENGIHTTVDTAGHVPYAFFERVLPYTDLFLYDIKCMDNEKHRKYTGVGNELLLDNLQRLLRVGAAVWIRVPVISGINDTVDDMMEIRRYFDRHGWPEKVELLPYHAMGEHKYGALAMNAPTFSVPSAETMNTLKKVFA